MLEWLYIMIGNHKFRLLKENAFIIFINFIILYIFIIYIIILVSGFLIYDFHLSIGSSDFEQGFKGLFHPQ
jgi:hypothetical protein